MKTSALPVRVSALQLKASALSVWVCALPARASTLPARARALLGRISDHVTAHLMDQKEKNKSSCVFFYLNELYDPVYMHIKKYFIPPV